jgi:hypothetical protein
MSGPRITPALMLVAAASLVPMAALHLGGVLDDGVDPYDPSHAGIAEAIIALVLAGGAAALVRGARGVAAATVAFAIAGFGVGLQFTIRGGAPIDVAYHVAVLPLLVLAFVLLLRGRHAGRGGGLSPRIGSQ